MFVLLSLLVLQNLFKLIFKVGTQDIIIKVHVAKINYLTYRSKGRKNILDNFFKKYIKFNFFIKWTYVNKIIIYLFKKQKIKYIW